MDNKLCSTNKNSIGKNENYVGGEKTAGKKLKAKNGWDNDGNGTDEFGFSALPGGYAGRASGVFYSIGISGDWWNASEGYYGDNASLILKFENTIGFYMLWILVGRVWVHIAIIP